MAEVKGRGGRKRAYNKLKSKIETICEIYHQINSHVWFNINAATPLKDSVLILMFKQWTFKKNKIIETYIFHILCDVIISSHKYLILFFFLVLESRLDFIRNLIFFLLLLWKKKKVYKFIHTKKKPSKQNNKTKQQKRIWK